MKRIKINLLRKTLGQVNFDTNAHALSGKDSIFK